MRKPEDNRELTRSAPGNRDAEERLLEWDLSRPEEAEGREDEALLQGIFARTSAAPDEVALTRLIAQASQPRPAPLLQAWRQLWRIWVPAAAVALILIVAAGGQHLWSPASPKDENPVASVGTLPEATATTAAADPEAVDDELGELLASMDFETELDDDPMAALEPAYEQQGDEDAAIWEQVYASLLVE